MYDEIEVNISFNCNTEIFFLLVGEPPSFKSKLKPIAIKEGDSCKLEVRVTGDPVPTVTWFKDDSQIQDTSVYKFLAGGGKVALVIDEAKLDMAGTYRVKISNDLGSKELSAAIEVEKGSSYKIFC